MIDPVTTESLTALRLERDRLAKENKDLRELSQEAIEIVVEENHKLRNALMQYANPNNWKFHIDDGKGLGTEYLTINVYGHGYDIAQEALK